MVAGPHTQRIRKNWGKYTNYRVQRWAWSAAFSGTFLGFFHFDLLKILEHYFQYDDQLLIAQQFFQLELVENRYIQVLRFC